MTCPARTRPLPEPSTRNCPTHHDWTERAAIAEFDGRLSRAAAERVADLEVRP